jgi:integrase
MSRPEIEEHQTPVANQEGAPPQQAAPPQREAQRRRGNRRDGLFQRNGWWWIDFEDGEGKRHRQKVALDYQSARLAYRDRVARIARGEVLGVREEGIHLRDFAEKKYWPTVQPALSPGERLRARSILDTQILPRFGGTRLVGLRREEIERWQADRLGVVSGSTTNKEIARLKHLLNRAVAWGYLRDSPARLVKPSKEAPGRTRYLTPEERDVLLNGRDAIVKAKDGRTWTAHQGPSPALRLYILAALQTGARRGELVNLRWADVDMKARQLTFRITKNGSSRTVLLTDTLRAALLALPRPLDPAAHVFPERDPQVLTRSFARLTQRLGLPGLRFHDLRHDAASTLTMAGVPQRTIMEILGHRDPRMTARYQHLSPEHLREAVMALDGAGREALRAGSHGTISAPAVGA